jgi:hypothetical protein
MVIPPVLSALSVRLSGPVMPPDKVNKPAPVVVKLLRLPFKVIPLVTVIGDVFVSLRAVTLLPMVALMVVRPVPVPLLAMVPVLLILPVEIVVVAVVLPLLIVTLPVPVIPPLTVVEPVPVDDMVRFLPLSPMAPLNIAAVLPPLLPIVNVPKAPVPILIALDTVNESANKLAEPPEELPKVIASPEGPKAPLVVDILLTAAIAVPDCKINPSLNVLLPLKVKVPDPSMVNPTVPDIVPAKLLAVVLLTVKTAAVLLSVMVPRVFPPSSVMFATV